MRASADRPNVVMILADNQASFAVGCYGEGTDFETPNIDALAADGVRLDRLYASHGYCSGGRATLLTGLLPSQHGVHSWLQDAHADSWPPGWCAVEEFRTLPATLAHRGYRTAHIGKWHLGDPGRPPLGYTSWLTCERSHNLDFYDNVILDGDRRIHVRDRHLVDYLSERAVEWISDSSDEQSPFFLTVWYDGPYALPPTNLGEDPRNPYYERFEGKQFSSVPRLPVADNYLRQLRLERFPDEEQRDELWSIVAMQNDLASTANFAAQCRLVDEGVGRIVAAIDESGMAEETLVVFSTDQGNLIGQHGRWGHASYSVPAVLYDDVFRIPFVARQPSRIPAGLVVDDLVAQYDLAPTLSEWTSCDGVEYAGSPGRSVAALLSGGTAAERPRDAVYFEQEETRGVRTDDYAYWCHLEGAGAYWRQFGFDWRGDEVLFDMASDPAQQHDVAQDPRYSEVLADLRTRLESFFEVHAVAEFDLWRGGTMKSSTDYPGVFETLYGPDWHPVVDRRPPFAETP